MTIIEAADSLGVTTATLRQQIRRGKMRATKRGRDWWVTASEVERYRRLHQAYCHICEGQCARPDMHWRSYDEEGNFTL